MTRRAPLAAPRALTFRRHGWASAALVSLGLCAGCAATRGEGEVSSDHLYAAGCVDGPFDLRPDFFASSPHLDTQLITIQAGDKMHDLSDGVTLSVNEVSTILEEHLGEALDVRLPAGVNAPGQAVDGREPSLVTLSMYLNDSCHEQNVSLLAMSGTITFSELFSGDLSDRKRSDRLIEGAFDVVVIDPRDLPVDGSAPASALTSSVQGNFRFYFRRGSGAQAFP